MKPIKFSPTARAILQRLRDQLPRLKTEEDRLIDVLDFSYANLACSTHHKPKRHAFQAMAIEQGMSEEAFERWADGREWW